jgi:hypothetical protein
MTEQEIKKSVEEYFNEMLSKDTDYLDHVTDSWIYDAENWFMKKHFSEIDAICINQFSTIAIERKNEIYDEKYGTRDAKILLNGLIYQTKELQNAFESIKHNLKVFPTFNNVVTKDIDNLIEHLQILSDIENGRVESLK